MTSMTVLKQNVEHLITLQFCMEYRFLLPVPPLNLNFDVTLLVLIHVSRGIKEKLNFTRPELRARASSSITIKGVSD